MIKSSIAAFLIVQLTASPVIAGASSLPAPVVVNKGQSVPFDGYLLSIELGAQLMQDSEKSKEIPLLNQELKIKDESIGKLNTDITDLKQDKQLLTTAADKQRETYESAHKYDGLIYGGFFGGGVVFTILLSLALAYSQHLIK